MTQIDFSADLAELDEVVEQADALYGELHTRHGKRVDMEQFYARNSDGAIIRIKDHEGMARARIHNDRYDRLLKKMSLEGMSYGEAVTSCDNEDLVVSGGIKRDKAAQVSLSEEDVARKHLRQAALKALRIHEKDGTPIHMEWVDNVHTLYALAGPRPTPTHTFGCIDHKKGFVPGNVRWQTRDDVLMAMGRRMVEYNGKQVTLTQLAKYTGVNVATIRARYESGVRGPELWNNQRLNGKYIVDFGGKKLTLSEAARRFGIHESTLRARLQSGAEGDALFSRPERGVSLKERGEARAPMQWADNVVKGEKE